MSNSKKAKTGTLSELEQSHSTHLSHLTSIRSHLQSIDIPSSSPALQSILRAVDEEERKANRDHKLRKKFAKEASKLQNNGGDGDGDCEEGWQDVSVPTSPADGVSPAAAAASAASDPLRASPELLAASQSSDGGVLSMDEDGDASDSAAAATAAATTSPLGECLAEAVTRAVADAGVKVSTPVAAVALAIHAALRSEVLGFRCTGIPDDDGDNVGSDSSNHGKKKKSGGFAAPIRELPKTKFVPEGWDRSASANSNSSAKVLLRYRKDGLGSTVLRVTISSPADDNNNGGGSSIVSISLTSSTTSEPSTNTSTGITFPLTQHINVAGLHAAIASERSRMKLSNPAIDIKVNPVLHYCDLSGLMTTLVRSFDLGTVNDPNQAEKVWEESTNGIMKTGIAKKGKGSFVAAMDVEPTRARPKKAAPPPAAARSDPSIVPGQSPTLPQPGRKPRVDDLFAPPPPGDFAGDLAPGGIRDPARGLFGQEDNTGSLMGPNHPTFRGGLFGDDYQGMDGGFGGFNPRPPAFGGTGMAPRFDPFYPPGVGPDGGKGVGRGGSFGGGRGGDGRGHGRGAGRGRGHQPPTGGDPNPDHLPPPNSFNSDMFM